MIKLTWELQFVGPLGGGEYPWHIISSDKYTTVTLENVMNNLLNLNGAKEKFRFPDHEIVLLVHFNGEISAEQSTSDIQADTHAMLSCTNMLGEPETT